MERLVVSGCQRYGMRACWVLRSEEHTSELQSRSDLVCRLLLEKKKIYPVLAITGITAASHPFSYAIGIYSSILFDYQTAMVCPLSKCSLIYVATMQSIPLVVRP